MTTGQSDTAVVWPFLGQTLRATILGAGAGIVVGAGAGLVLSNSPRAEQVLRPFILGLNAVPRIALIPIIVILFGPTLIATAVTGWLIVVFVVFFNAYEGGKSIAPEMLANARILGANNASIMVRVRLPYVLAWTFAALPNAVSFGLVGVVTAEILTGTQGMGRLLVIALSTVQATQTFALVVILAAVGVVLVEGTAVVRRRVLHWWDVGYGM